MVGFLPFRSPRQTLRKRGDVAMATNGRQGMQYIDRRTFLRVVGATEAALALGASGSAILILRGREFAR
jgi:hypothetical protein